MQKRRAALEDPSESGMEGTETRTRPHIHLDGSVDWTTRAKYLTDLPCKVTRYELERERAEQQAQMDPRTALAYAAWILDGARGWTEESAKQIRPPDAELAQPMSSPVSGAT